MWAAARVVALLRGDVSRQECYTIVVMLNQLLPGRGRACLQSMVRGNLPCHTVPKSTFSHASPNIRFKYIPMNPQALKIARVHVD